MLHVGFGRGGRPAAGSRRDKPSPQALGIVELIKSEAAKTPITVHRLRGNVAILEGSGGNIAVLTGPDGKVLVDAGIAVSRPQVADRPGGARPRAGHASDQHPLALRSCQRQRVAARARRRRSWPRRTRSSIWRRCSAWRTGTTTSRPCPPRALPTEVFATERTLKLNGTTLALKYYGPAHTDSDISVQFTEADILHTGDTFWNGIYPFIDYSTGGSIDGSIRAADANLAVTTDKTIIIPGHGPPVSNRAELQDFRDMLVGIRDNVAALKQQGRSLEEIVAAKPTAAYDAKWGQFVISPALFTKLVYEGV